MTYRVQLSKQAKKFLEKLDVQLSERLKTRLRFLRENPYRYLENFEGARCHKFRLGEYRALVDVDDKQKQVWI